MAEHELNKIVDDDGEVFNLRDSTKQPVADRVTSIRASSSASDDKYPSEKAVASAIESLDVSSVGGSGKYISAISETDGKISATATTMDTTPTESSQKAVTSGGIYSALDGKVSRIQFSQPAEYKSFVVIEDVTQWYDPDGTQAITKGYQMIGQLAFWRAGGGYEQMGVAFIKFHLNYRWQLNNESCFEMKTTLPTSSFRPMIIKDARDENNIKYYFGLKVDAAWMNTVQFIGRTRDLNFSNLVWIEGKNQAQTGNGTNFPTGITVERECDVLEWDVKNATDATYASNAKSGSNLQNVLDYKVGRTTFSVTVPANTTKYISVQVSYDMHTYLMFFNGTQGVLGQQYLFRTYGSGGTSRTSVNYIGRSTTVFDWYVAGGEGREFLIKYANDSSGQQSFTFAVVSLDGSTLPTIELKDSVPEGWVPQPVSGVVKAQTLTTARTIRTNLASTSTASFDGSANVTPGVTGTLAPGNGGTGKTSLKAAEYNLTTGKSEISDTTSGDDRVVFELASPSESNGVTRGFRKLSTIWTWIKGLLSSESGVNISGSSASCTGNAATATKATQDSDGNAINATYFKSSGNTTLVAGAATKIGTQNGADVKLTLPSHQDISGKMNTSASNATAPSGSGGDGATATLLNNLTEGNSDIVTTDDGDNVLIATTDNGGSVTNKWYKRKLVKLIPWIIKKLGTRLVYDCGAGSTSGDDFDAALAAFNAGQWVIIHDSANVYYCAGTYNSGLRFKRLTNSASGISVNTLNWTRGSSPSAGSQLDASLSGHTHTRSDVTNFAHTHGNIQDSGALQTSDVTIASGDKLVVTDSSDSGKVARASASFDGSTTTKALTQKGTFETFMTPSAGNAASGALQNLTGQLSEGTSDFTDNTEIFTSYAGNNGFAESGHVNQPYRRKASSMLNYVRNGFAIDRSPADVGTTHKRISLGYGKYSSSNYVGAITYIVRLFFNYADGGGLQGKGITVLVTYDFRRSGTQKAECRILSDNGVRDAGYNVVLANYVTGSGDNGKLYICIGLVKNSAPTTLVEFNYSYCKIFKVGTIGDWVQDITSDAVGTYNYIVQATDLVSNAVNADMVDGKHIVIGSWAGASNTIYFG